MIERVIHKQDLSVIRSFVTDALPTARWIENGFGRRYAKYSEAPNFNEVFALYGMKPIRVEPMFQCFIGNHYLDGACVHEHQDSNDGDLVHTRVNVMLKKPKHGGNPVLNGVEVNVEEGDIWLCIAGEERHSSTPVLGGERLIFSYGGLVKRNEIEALEDGTVFVNIFVEGKQ